MTLKNATNKLIKAGYLVSRERISITAEKAGQARVIEFFLNGGREDEITCIRVRRKTDQDDHMSDYCAGFFCETITSAIKQAAM